MPETKAYSHSQGLGFCGKVQAGQRLDGRGMRSRAQLTQSLRHKRKDTLTRQRSSYRQESALMKEDDRTLDSCSISFIYHVYRQLGDPFCRLNGGHFDQISGWKLCPYPLKPDPLNCISTGCICLFLDRHSKERAIACNKAVFPTFLACAPLKQKICSPFVVERYRDLMPDTMLICVC